MTKKKVIQIILFMILDGTSVASGEDLRSFSISIQV